LQKSVFHCRMRRRRQRVGGINLRQLIWKVASDFCSWKRRFSIGSRFLVGLNGSGYLRLHAPTSKRQ